uniref:Uncharacterized protein n=1 Tax=Zea mays TaxID=4577 RepID=B6U0F1_MAIZE|nr:hypothetical protein [Zea mays]
MRMTSGSLSPCPSRTTSAAASNSSTGTVIGASESTPHMNNSKASIQDSAKNKKI